MKNPDMLDEEAMRTQVLAQVVTKTSTERLRLRYCGGGIAANFIASPVDLPSAPIATMDGFAARAAELPATLTIAGEVRAGTPYTTAVPVGHCVAIATGAWVPADLDVVVPLENVTTTSAAVTLPAPATNPAYIRPAASELRIGEPVLNPGTTLTARKLALLASLGIDRASVYCKPRIGVLATGDELRQPGETLCAGAIYDANRPLILRLLVRHGCIAHDLGVARDDAATLRAALTRGKAECDAVITIGGASVGKRDLVRSIVTEFGELHAWQVAIKPGKPFLLGTLGTVPLFGLPGNPASALVTFACLVLPALWKLAGHVPLPQLPWLRATASQDLPKVPGRTDYQRGLLSTTTDGSWEVRLAGAQNAGSLPVLATADCLIRLPRATGDVAAGTTVTVLPLSALD